MITLHNITDNKLVLYLLNIHSNYKKINSNNDDYIVNINEFNKLICEDITSTNINNIANRLLAIKIDENNDNSNKLIPMFENISINKVDNILSFKINKFIKTDLDKFANIFENYFENMYRFKSNLALIVFQNLLLAKDNKEKSFDLKIKTLNKCLTSKDLPNVYYYAIIKNVFDEIKLFTKFELKYKEKDKKTLEILIMN